jgi:hypothetical protein
MLFVMLSVVTLNVVMLNVVCYAECCYADCRGAVQSTCPRLTGSHLTNCRKIVKRCNHEAIDFHSKGRSLVDFCKHRTFSMEDRALDGSTYPG